MTTMSEISSEVETPRTDDARDVCANCRLDLVSVEFAQELERETIGLQAEVAELRAKLAEVRGVTIDECAEVCDAYALEDVTEEAASGMESCAGRIRNLHALLEARK